MTRHEGGDWEWDDTDDITESRQRKKLVGQQREKEARQQGFDCDHCREWVPISEEIGTHNRNHCPHCLWSKHVDAEKPGDRKADCGEGMKPIALTFKGEAQDRYVDSTERNLGELMLVHECVRDDQIRINRIAADDNPGALLGVFYESQSLPDVVMDALHREGIEIASTGLESVVRGQLFGREVT